MGRNRTAITKAIGVHKSTISRELRRYQGRRGYRPKQAHRFALRIKNKAESHLLWGEQPGYSRP